MSRSLHNLNPALRLKVSNPRDIVSVPEPDHEWESKSISRLEELINLDSGWDGYNGQPVSLENANFALGMLENLYSPGTPAPQIVPGVSGDLQIEWHTHSVEIELHILAPNEVRAWVRDTQSFPEGREFDLTLDFTDLIPHIKHLKEHFSDPAAT